MIIYCFLPRTHLFERKDYLKAALPVLYGYWISTLLVNMLLPLVTVSI